MSKCPLCEKMDFIGLCPHNRMAVPEILALEKSFHQSNKQCAELEAVISRLIAYLRTCHLSGQAKKDIELIIGEGL